MEIELRRDVAKYVKRPDGKYNVIEFPQWILMVDGKQWGYVSKKLGSPIQLIRRVDDATKKELQAAVIRLVGERSSVNMPPEVLEDEEEDEFYDEDDDEA